jgi:hypothetical protein
MILQQTQRVLEKSTLPVDKSLFAVLQSVRRHKGERSDLPKGALIGY